MGSLFHKRGKDTGSTPSPITPPTSSSGSLAVEVIVIIIVLSELMNFLFCLNFVFQARRASAQAIKEAEIKQTKKETTIPVRTVSDEYKYIQ